MSPRHIDPASTHDEERQPARWFRRPRRARDATSPCANQPNLYFRQTRRMRRVEDGQTGDLLQKLSKVKRTQCQRRSKPLFHLMSGTSGVQTIIKNKLLKINVLIHDMSGQCEEVNCLSFLHMRKTSLSLSAKVW